MTTAGSAPTSRFRDGQELTITVDNRQPPGGLARTIGFWKNHASCKSSNGNQKPVLDQTLQKAEPGGITIGDLTLRANAADCAKAVSLLNKSTIDGKKKMASDPAFNMAAQLLAAKLNVVAGAGACQAAADAIAQGQALLAAIDFVGTTTYKKMTAAQVTQANNLATILDKYNNNLLCT